MVNEPLMPHGEASVPISTMVPVRRYASSVNARSILAVLPEKKAVNEAREGSICLHQMQFFGAPLYSSQAKAAHRFKERPHNNKKPGTMAELAYQ